MITRRISVKSAGLGILVFFMLFGSSQLLYSAPKVQYVLEGLFGQTDYSDTKASVDDKGNISYTVNVDLGGDGQTIAVTIQELSSGYGWIWTSVKKFDGAIPPLVFRKIAQINDDSRFASLSAGARSDGGAGSEIYINYCFLMRTADGAALQAYIENLAIQKQEFEQKLKD